MTQEIDPNISKLAALTEYVGYIVSLFPASEAEENTLCLVLQCFKMTLQRRVDKRSPTAAWNDVMRWAVAESNSLLAAIYDDEHENVIDWNPAWEPPTNPQQNLAAVLMTLCHELHDDIRASEDYLRDQLKMAAHEFAKEIWAAQHE